LQDKGNNSFLTVKLLREEEKLLACIHCGLCLEACPTYTLTGDENDGPRGRLYLMRAVGEGRLANTSKAFSQHIDRCLGCRACEQVCPAGVEYGQLLEASRAELREAGSKRGFINKVLQSVLRRIWLYPARLRFAFSSARLFRDSGLARLLLASRLPRLVSARFELALALLQSSAPIVLGKDRLAETGKNSRAAGIPGRADVFLFTGCVTEGLFARVNRATTRVLEANSFAVHVPREQVCCGALHAHAGDLEGARILARKNIEAFKDAGESTVITNAGGCGAMLATYGHLLDGDESIADEARKFSARIRDISQQLATVAVQTGAGISAGTVTYDASCHLLYGQHSGEASLEMLGTIPGLDFASLEGAERCCGGAGIYNLMEPEMSQSVLREKLAQIVLTKADILTTGNPGCQMQIGAGARLSGMPLKVCHPVELLDESYRRAGFYD
jgi:glycolate oxidase iron-sulfur subunit